MITEKLSPVMQSGRSLGPQGTLEYSVRPSGCVHL
jgi:hypothetical protein